MATILEFPASSFIPDINEQLVNEDAGANFVSHSGRPALAFDATNEEAALTPEVAVPTQYTGSGPKAVIYLYSEYKNDGNGVVLDVFVESKTPNSDTLNMNIATSWDSVNSGIKDLSSDGTNPLTLEIDLNNNDSMAVGDLVRFGLRRDTDSPGDTASGDLFISCLEIQDDG